MYIHNVKKYLKINTKKFLPLHKTPALKSNTTSSLFLHPRKLFKIPCAISPLIRPFIWLSTVEGFFKKILNFFSPNPLILGPIQRSLTPRRGNSLGWSQLQIHIRGSRDKRRKFKGSGHTRGLTIREVKLLD